MTAVQEGTNISVMLSLPLSGCVAVANYHKVICNDLNSFLAFWAARIQVHS